MSDRLFDRTQYSPKTLETFEIMSAYYVDIFYNHLYTEAKKIKANGSVPSVTEGYKHTLNAFLKSLENPKLYKKSIVGLHHYFISVGFVSISFSNFIDKLTKEFIPIDYSVSLTSTKKMGVLRIVLSQSVKSFIRKIVNDYMSKIIDFHTEVDNVRLLQDELIDCFIIQREGMFQRFISEKTHINKNEVVDHALAEKMHSEIKRLIKEKYEQQKNIINIKKIFLKKNEENNKLKEVIGDLRSQIYNITSKLEIYKSTENAFVNNNYHKPNNTAPVHIDITDEEDYDNKTVVIEEDYDKKSVVIEEDYDKKSVVIEEDYDKESVVIEEDYDKKSVVNKPIKKQLAVRKKSSKQKTLSEDNIKLRETINDDKVSKFIEVNPKNIHNIVSSGSDELHKFNNTTMDEGTMLYDFL
jgi:hypothetical protein